jgi:hypothetical protein
MGKDSAPCSHCGRVHHELPDILVPFSTQAAQQGLLTKFALIVCFMALKMAGESATTIW